MFHDGKGVYLPVNYITGRMADSAIKDLDEREFNLYIELVVKLAQYLDVEKLQSYISMLINTHQYRCLEYFDHFTKVIGEIKAK